MPLEVIFQITSTLILPGWLLLAFFPGWRGAQLIAAIVIPGILAAIYAALLLTGLGGGGFEGDFGSLEGVKALMSNDRSILAGWIHYLAFDLFVGAWEARDAHRNNVSRWILVVCLFLTLMAGPFGFLLYLGARTVHLRRLEGPSAH